MLESVLKRKLNYSNGESEGIVIFYHKNKKLYPVAIDIETLDLITFIIGSSGLTIIDQPIDANIYRVKTKENKDA